MTWLNTLVGAVPGALPPLMGWTAARGELSSEGLALFAIQAFWQLPHFMAIAWIYREEYARAGFKMLPVVDPEGRRTGRQAVSYTLALLVVSLCPFLFNLAGPVYLAGALILGLAFVWFAFQFSRQPDSLARPAALLRLAGVSAVAAGGDGAGQGQMNMQATAQAIPHTEVHEARHEEAGFWRTYVFSTDHKVIGIQYGITALCFLLFGFCLMMVMRWQIAHPGEAVPVLGPLLASIFGDVAAKGIVSPDLYNSFGAMHGTIMVFMAIVPLAFAAFGNYVVPLQIGAPDMAFPRVNMASYQAYVVGGLIMFTSFFIPGGPAQAGWTSYSPLATSIPTDGQTFWIIGMVFLITSSLLGAVNFIATIIQLRAPGMTWMRLPFFVWAQFVTAFLLLLAFPPLEAAAVMQLMDKVAHTSFFLPTGLAIGGNLAHVSGGGSPLLWQHLFWFLAHPGGLCADSAGDGHRRRDHRQ